MLADRILPTLWAKLPDAAELLSSPLTQRFLVSQPVLNLARDMRADEAMMRHTVLPAGRVWLEWPDDGIPDCHTAGALLLDLGGGDVRCHVMVQGGIKYRGYDPFLINFAQARFENSGRPALAPVYKLTMRRIVPMLALINQPRVTVNKDVERGKLNKHRVKAGKAPLLDHREVVLHVNAVGAKVAGGTGDGTGKRLHHVRSFIRTRLGKVELVRNHWRGSASLGVVTHHHKVVL